MKTDNAHFFAISCVHFIPFGACSFLNPGLCIVSLDNRLRQCAIFQATGGIDDVDKISINNSTREQLEKFFLKREKHLGKAGKTDVQCFPLFSILKAIGMKITSYQL